LISGVFALLSVRYINGRHPHSPNGALRIPQELLMHFHDRLTSISMDILALIRQKRCVARDTPRQLFAIPLPVDERNEFRAVLAEHLHR
jgi:hypothetical protein